MDDSVRKELNVLKGMVAAWKASYLTDIPVGGGGEFLVEEFLDEIEVHVYPYVRRLRECQYLSEPEAEEFLGGCYNEVEELRDALRGPKVAQPSSGGG